MVSPVAHLPASPAPGRPAAPAHPVAVDWLACNLFLAWQDRRTLIPLLDHHLAQLGQRPDASTTFTHRGLDFTLTRPRPNSDDRFAATWCLQSAGIALLLQRPKPTLSADPPRNGQVMIPGSALLGGHVQAIQHAQRMLAALGLSCGRWELSRVDLAIDLLDQPVAELVEAVRDGRVVGIGRGAAEEHLSTTADRHGPTGFTIKPGKSLTLRVYDKLAAPNFDRQRDQLIKRWGRLPAHVTRVEYQLRRDAIKRCQLDTLNDLVDKLPDTYRWCLGQIRLTDRPPTPGNQARAPLHPAWVHAGQIVDAWAADYVPWAAVPGSDLSQPSYLPASAENLIHSAAGSLAASVAQGGTLLDNLRLLLERLLDPDVTEKLLATCNQRGIDPRDDMAAVMQLLGVLRDQPAAGRLTDSDPATASALACPGAGVLADLTNEN